MEKVKPQYFLFKVQPAFLQGLQHLWKFITQKQVLDAWNGWPTTGETVNQKG